MKDTVPFCFLLLRPHSILRSGVEWSGAEWRGDTGENNPYSVNGCPDYPSEARAPPPYTSMKQFPGLEIYGVRTASKWTAIDDWKGHLLCLYLSTSTSILCGSPTEYYHRVCTGFARGLYGLHGSWAPVPVPRLPQDPGPGCSVAGRLHF